MTQRKHYNFPVRKSFTLLALAAAMQSAYANNLNIDKIWYRDYLDFAQNKGIFKPGATGLELVQKDGSIFKLPDLPFPDFSAVSKKGMTTSIGGAYVVTAKHNEKYTDASGKPAHHAIATQQWGNTVYNWAGSGNNGDFAVQRLNKFVVETEGFDGVEFTQNQANWNAMHERYGMDINGKRKVIVYRIGVGNAQITQGGQTSSLGFVHELGWLSGSIIEIEKWGAGWTNQFPFSNTLTEGDSGSAWLVYDNVEKKWVILGTLLGVALPTQGLYNPWHNGTINKFKNFYTVNVALDNRTATFLSNTELSVDGNSFNTTRKDVSLTGGGTITLSSNLDMGIGGLIFDKNQHYTVEGKDFTFKGAGLDIAEGTTVDWNVKGASGDNLHKIGKGTLKVNVAQGNKLKVGNGTVELNVDNAFNAIYITSGKATVKLNSDQALSGGDFGGIYFATNGGTLDLNGHNFNVQKIAAADNGAIITNSSAVKSTVQISTQDKYIYHGSLSGNLDLDYKHETKPGNGLLILDGGTDIKGDINVSNGKVVMMGHATTHAIMPQCRQPALCQPPPANRVQNAERVDAEKTGKEYMISNTVSDFRQPDWETRKYKFETLNLNGAEFQVGRNAIIEGNIVSSNSNLMFGGASDVYLDRHDGLNITGEGFGFQQNVVAGQSRADSTILYIGDIDAENSTIESWMPYFEASLNLQNGSSFIAHEDSLVKVRDKGIHVSSGSTLILNDILVENNPKEVEITKSEDSQLNLRNVIAKNASVNLKGEYVSGALLALDKGVVNVDDWDLQNGNIETIDSGLVRIGKLNTVGSQVASANLSIIDELNMSDLNPSISGADASAWVGLSANRITLGRDTKVSASFSNDFLSLNNITYDTKYTLIEAKELQDNRTDEKINFTLQGDGVLVQSNKDNNKIVFEFVEKPQPDLETPPPTIPDLKPPVNPDTDDRPQAQEIENAFLQMANNPRADKIYQAILQHNQNSDLAYQEVAIKDALTMGSVNEGASALTAIANRTDRMFASTARTITQSRMIQPVRSAIDSRLASLRTSKYKNESPNNSSHNQLASIRDVFEKEALHQSIYIDISGGYQKDSGRKDRVVSTNFGFDKLTRLNGDLVIFGGAFSVTNLNNQDGEAADDGRMYSLTGYVSREADEGWGFQSYITAGHLANDRSFTPEISIGRQRFDEKSWMIMNSNYIKYRFNLGDISVKPMLLADLGWTHTSDSQSSYLKRDSLSNTTLDLGVGVEVEGNAQEMSWMVQLAARRNVWHSADTVGVNLKNAQGFISYDIEDQNATRLEAYTMISHHLSRSMALDLATGATASSDGALGLNGNVRLRWEF